MTQKEVMEALKISRGTLANYRKKLGIFEETKKFISKTNFQKIKSAKEENDYMYQEFHNKMLEEDIAISSKEIMNYSTKGDLKILDNDSQEVINLKNDYNFNRKFIEYYQGLINFTIESKKIIPSKISQDLSTYQKLNIKIQDSLIALNPKTEDDGMTSILERLKSYN